MMEPSVIRRLLLGALVSSIVGLGTSEAAAQGAYLQVSKTEAGFTVEAEEATLPQVLSALGDKAGFAVQDTGAVRPVISVFEVRDATLEATLRQLLGTSNHLIVYRGGSQKIEEGSIEKIVLLSPGKRERAAGRPVSSLAGPGADAPPPRRAAATPPPDGTASFEQAIPQDDQLVYGEALEEMERQMVEQLGVDPGEIATGEPGVRPPLPPGVLQKLEAFANGDPGMPPPEMVAPGN